VTLATCEGLTSADLLWEWCRLGWVYRQVGARPQAEQDWYAERVKYEMGLILSKGFDDFFLVTSDMVRWAKDNGIAIGPGRGSVAASVVSWLLRITEVDPYQYPHLLFERFLDVNRADPPDIDLDIEDDRRHELFERMAAKYGSECVGTVANFVRYRGKNSLADIATVYRLPKWAKEAVAALLVERSGGDSRFDASLEDTVAMFPNARAVFDQFPEFWEATRLEGNYRGWSVHAAGMIVSPTPLTDLCSLYIKNGRQILGIDKYDVEYTGALKMDMLGLTTMSIIARCLAMVGMTLEDLYAIPEDDPETLAVFQNGDVTGVFQFEGRATRLVNRDVVPDNFGEIVDINALSRPGPLFSGQTAAYVDIKHGRRKRENLHPLITEITGHTQGQMIFQEQILRILRDIGGFDWFSVGQIRRIISKKLGEAAFQMNFERFADGARERAGMDAKLADKVWRLMVTSGTYSFVYAHAVSYSKLGYWCAYLKSHHPLEFYAASLSKTDDAEQQFKLMKDAEQHDIDIRPPQLGISRRSWVAHHDLAHARRELVAGWVQVPKIGPVLAARLEAEDAAEPFRDWDHLSAVRGVGPKTITRIEAFAGAEDPFGLKRTERALGRARAFLRATPAIPTPTHNGAEIAAIYVEQNYGATARKNYGKGPKVIYAGIVKERNMQDAVENRRSRSGEAAEDILKTLKRPDLLEYCSLRCYDETDEEVYLRVNRWVFPKLKRVVESITVGHDVVVAVGNRIAGFGTPVMVDRLWVVDPD
jgi:DNA polymerase III subunit alpha